MWLFLGRIAGCLALSGNAEHTTDINERIKLVKRFSIRSGLISVYGICLIACFYALSCSGISRHLVLHEMLPFRRSCEFCIKRSAFLERRHGCTLCSCGCLSLPLCLIFPPLASLGRPTL